MKKLLLLLMVGFAAVAANAQTTCNATMTWTQAPNTYNVTFTNTSTVAPAMPSSPFAQTYRSVRIGNLQFASNNTYTHTFAGPGTYTVIAGVNYMDSVGSAAYYCNDTTWYSVTVAAQPCAVSVTSVTGSGATRTFTANGGVGTAGTTYTWNFGNGSPTVTGTSVTYTYPTPGTYTVTVTASAAGCSQSATTTVTIAAPLNCANVSNSFTVSGTSATRTFSPIATPTNVGRTHYWNFGNGSTAVSYGAGTASTTYLANGTYTACLITVWADSAYNTTCSDTSCQTVTITNAGFSCANASNSFTANTYGLSGYFYATVTPGSTPGVTVQNNWDYGNGVTANTGVTTSSSHLYATSGTYTVRLITRWLQSGTTNVLCADTAYQTITVAPINAIYGWVVSDSTVAQPVDTFKVWLISFNSSTNMLSAVDSLVTVGTSSANFQFNNKPAGIYRTKAHKLNQAAMSTGYVPTYRDSSLTWSLANPFTHNNNQTYTGGIYLRHGLVTSGPGFVGGNVLMGANKGTADGDPVANQLVFLRDASGNLVQSATTNAAGQYSFTNIPVGTYTVYPEEMNYVTTASAPVTITAGSTSATGLGFKKDDAGMSIKPASATGIRNVAVASFALMPNPTSGVVTLAFGTNVKGSAEVRVTSLTGQVVHQAVINAASNVSLDLAHLHSGVYFVNVSTEAGTHSEKLLLKK